MREIKFREPLFLDEKFTRLHYWGLVSNGFIGTVHIKGKHYQYTGLKDKNGKEIYESDILKSGKNHWKVVFLVGGFVMSPINKSGVAGTLSYFINEKVEIIGNIYSNPEMVESND